MVNLRVLPGYSTQQIKYKNSETSESEVPLVEDRVFEEEPLLQERSSSSVVSLSGFFFIILLSVC